MKNLILLFSVAFLFYGCGSYKKKLDNFKKFANENPEELARLCSDRFPPAYKYIPGIPKVTPSPPLVIRDTIDCPDGTRIPFEKIAEVPPEISTTDTVYLQDMARIFILNNTISELQTTVHEKNQEIKNLEEKLESEKDIAEKYKKQNLTKIFIIIGMVALAMAYLWLKPRIPPLFKKKTE